MSRILVAGGGGFIGGHLVKRLLDDGHEVTAVDVKPLHEWWQRHDGALNRSSLDLGREKPVQIVMGDEHFDEVYNLACNMGGMFFIENNKAACMLNVLINTHLLQAAVRTGVERYLFTSTACVYRHDLQQGHAIQLKESDAYPADPEDGYGWEKLFSERMCQNFSEDFGIETRVARLHTVFGPQESWRGGREKVPAAFCRKVIEVTQGKSDAVEVWGDGQQERSFLYVDDCVEGLVHLMRSDLRTPVNIGSPDHMPIERLLKVVEKIAGVEKLPRRYVPGPLGVRGRSADITLMREVTGWEPTVSLEDGMRVTFDWIKEQMDV